MTDQFDAIVAEIVDHLAGIPDTGGDRMTTAARMRAWLVAGPPGRADLDALCRQIDVRHSIAAQYRSGWGRVDDEVPADAVTVAGAVAVLLRSAAADDDAGRSLKAVNSALKGLELRDDVPDAPVLRARALRLLDDHTRSDA